MKKIKITAVRKVAHRDLSERCENPIDHACGLHEGQIFLCTDGFRPVSFLIETLEE